MLAHEFAHYDGAIGPEGKRRTVTYYGPVVGGLPIQAWHCEVCGLLRLSFPDGRTEERRLFPGPQPGLLAEPAAVAPERELYGLQAHVSGLSASPSLIERLTPQPAGAPAVQLPRIVLPEWDTATWLAVLGLSCITVMLFILAVMAVAGYSTPSTVVPLAIVTTLTFTAVLVVRLGAAGIRHFFPSQPGPSVVERLRPSPVLDGVTRTVITLLVLAIIGFFLAAVLAVYSYSTPGAVWPVILASIALAVAALVVKIAAAAYNHFARR